MTCGVLILIPFRRARFLFGLVRKWTSEAMVAGFSGTENTPLGFRVKVSALCWSTKNLRLAPVRPSEAVVPIQDRTTTDPSAQDERTRKRLGASLAVCS